MVASEKWAKNKWPKDAKGKKVMETILMPSFWKNILDTLKFMGPLVAVLRLVDSEKKPAMGYIYAAMLHAKEAIAKSFHGNAEKYKEVFAIIDKRWECQLKHPLHLAGYFLNPEFFYSKPEIEYDKDITEGLWTCIERLVPEQTVQDMIFEELPLYKRADGLFGFPIAKRSRSTKSAGNLSSIQSYSSKYLLVNLLIFLSSLMQWNGGAALDRRPQISKGWPFAFLV